MWLVMAIGAVLVVLAAVLLVHNTPTPTDAGTVPATAAVHAAGPTPSAAAVALPQLRSTVAPAPQSAPPPSTASARSAPPGATDDVATATSQHPAASPAAGHPTVLHLPTLDVSAHIDPVDSDHGVLQVPEDISRVGWWQHSAAPGSTAGSTVIDGHIDSAVAGEGALFHLADLGPGDPVAVTTSTGVTVHYRVQARRVYVKEQGLPAELFDQHGPGRLVIISCGGTFDKTIRSYEDNIAVFATAIS